MTMYAIYRRLSRESSKCKYIMLVDKFGFMMAIVCKNVLAGRARTIVVIRRALVRRRLVPFVIARALVDDYVHEHRLE